MASSYGLTKEDMMALSYCLQGHQGKLIQGDRLERLEQVVESIALRLGLLVDDDEANVFEQGNQHGGRSQESEDYSFSDGYAHEEQDSQNKRKIPASDLDEHEEVSVPPTKFSWWK